MKNKTDKTPSKKNDRRRKVISLAWAGVSATGLVYTGAVTIPAEFHLTSQLDCAPHNNVSATSPAYQDNAEATTINVFNTVATPEHVNILSDGTNDLILSDLAQDQQKYMQEHTAQAENYNNYLAEFEQFKGQPLCQLAESVNNKVLKDITYNINPHWITPAEIVADRTGDCKHFATLQYFLLRHLGVSEDRMYLTLVDAAGNPMDHAFLTLNIAEEGQPENLVVLNDAGFITSAQDYVKGGLYYYRGLKDLLQKEGWPDNYKLYDMQNENGDWQTKLYKDYVAAASVSVRASQQPQALPRLQTKLFSFG